MNFAFDWPQNEIMSDSFFSYFAQLRGGRISPSLVFSNTEAVKAADNGRILALITEHPEGDLFESTLGNAVIISHEDDMLSVYGNLDDVSELHSRYEVSAGDHLGESSLSGWQEGDSCLEFQVIDLKSKCFINPRVLMPRIGNELEIVLHNVSAVNKAGISYALSSVQTLNAGSYLIYNERQDVAVPYKTSIFINGVTVENIFYDSLYDVDGKLNLKGRDMHSLSSVYPDDKRSLLGEVVIPRGHNELTVVASDILGKEYQATYVFEAR
ncbi:MAG: peptidoglycan DD-metalloendopeptidase family protein [Treponema sp.]|nr:peptidoglycan DD-metalloendopeptidase family protein [Treponema sp.]